MRMREDVLREYMTPIPLCYVALGDGPLVPKDNIDVNAMADRIAELEARIETVRLTGTTTGTAPSIPTTVESASPSCTHVWVDAVFGEYCQYCRRVRRSISQEDA